MNSAVRPNLPTGVGLIEETRQATFGLACIYGGDVSAIQGGTDDAIPGGGGCNPVETPAKTKEDIKPCFFLFIKRSADLFYKSFTDELNKIMSKVKF